MGTIHRVVAVCALLALALAAQPAAVPPDLRFEVASLKPSASAEPGGGILPAPGGQRYEATNCPIKIMIQVAYRVRADQVVGGPSWLETDRYHMEAKAEKPSTSDELRVMLVNVLVDRLHLLPLRFPPGAMLNGEPVDTSGPSLIEAVKQQLGLELKAQKGPVPVIVIDHVEKPTAN